MAFERADAPATGDAAGDEARPGRVELPHLDGLVETATDEATASGGKGNTVDTVLVAVLAFETDDELAALDVPDTDALVEGTGGDEEVVGRDGDGGDAVLDGEVCNLRVGLEVPQTDTAVATAGSNDAAVAGKVETVNVLLVAGELVLDGAAGNVPDLGALVGCNKEEF